MIDDDSLSPDLRDLFDAERRRDDVPPGAKDRVHAALSASIGVGFGGAGAATKAAVAAKGAAVAKAAGSGAAVASGAGAASGAAGATAVTATGGALAKGLAFALVAAMAGTAGTGVYLAAKDDAPSDKTVVVEPSPADDAAWDPSILGKKPPEPPPLAQRPQPKPAPIIEAKPLAAPVVVQHAPEAPVETPEQKAERLVGERTILDDARAAVGRGDGGTALIALEAHRTRYPDGALVEEREALTVLALAKLDRMDEAKAKAEKFRARYPQSLLLGAVDAAIPH